MKKFISIIIMMLVLTGVFAEVYERGQVPESGLKVGDKMYDWFYEEKFDTGWATRYMHSEDLKKEYGVGSVIFFDEKIDLQAVCVILPYANGDGVTAEMTIKWLNDEHTKRVICVQYTFTKEIK